MKKVILTLTIASTLTACDSMPTQTISLDIPEGDYYIWQCYARSDYKHQQKPLILIASTQDNKGYIYYNEKIEKAFQQTEGLTRAWYWGPNYKEQSIDFSIMLHPGGDAEYRNEAGRTLDSKYQMFKCKQTK